SVAPPLIVLIVRVRSDIAIDQVFTALPSPNEIASASRRKSASPAGARPFACSRMEFGAASGGSTLTGGLDFDAQPPRARSMSAVENRQPWLLFISPGLGASLNRAIK